MSGIKYDKEILENVLHTLENEKIRAEADAEARKLKIYSALPRVAEIDAALRTTVFDVIRASFGKGEDTAALIARAKEKNTALVAERKKLTLPERVVGVIKCKNPRCITSVEREIVHEFVLADADKKAYRCIYCDHQAK